MLEMTLATNFVPGTNLKGDVAGANWLFLLPDLNLERVLCLGRPPSTTLTTLLRFSQEVIIIGPDSGQILSRGGREGRTRLRPMVSNGSSALPLADGSIDLVLIVENPGKTAGERGSRGAGVRETFLLCPLAPPHLCSDMRRLLKPEGLIYLELNGLVDRLRFPKVLNGFYAASNQKDGQDVSAPYIFWLTPLGGEMQTAVPLVDQETMDYFLQHGLYSPSVNEHTLKHLLLGRGKRSRGAGEQGGRGEMFPAPQQPRSLASLLRAPGALALTTVRGVGKNLLETMGRLEGAISGHHWFGRFTRRYGLLLGGGADETANRPPQYLRSVVQKAGINIDHYRWGLVARGRYNSRKVLFFLFDRTSRVPEYIVKMTRNPTFNPRLENEYRVLSILQEKGIGNRETLPQAVFLDHHGDLAIVGETMIEGVPFRRRTKWTADCPYGCAAIDWLIELGAATADSTNATPAQVAEGLKQLFTRFVEIYHLTPEQRAFLDNQIALIAGSREAFPLVFQHGDPGTWNVMTTPSGRVAFLDWEAAEPQGMPLWDLFYFLRSYCIGATHKQGIRDSLSGFERQFLGESSLSLLVLETTRRYCQRTNLPANLIEPLFYTCWMHRALKQATSLSPTRLERGHYVNLLRLCIDQRERPMLQRLFS